MITVLIDYDDTLNDTGTLFSEKLDGFFGMNGRDIYCFFLYKVHRDIVEKKYPQWHDDIDEHVRLLFQLLDLKYDRYLAKKFVMMYQEAERETWMKPRFFPDTISFLVEVKNKGYTICLITGPHSTDKANCLERVAGEKLFSWVFGEDTLGVSKTNPHYYQLVLKKAGSKPGQTYCIGDTLSHDVKPAIDVGIKTFWVNRRGEENHLGVKPDFEVENLTQALQILEKLNPC